MKDLYSRLPDTPGVYLMKGKGGQLLYVGKAANLKRRVSSYFLRPHDARIAKMVSEIRKIDFKNTDTAIEALILEAKLIKKFSPPYNVKDKDDKSFLYMEITKEPFPRVILIRGKERGAGELFGPFTSSSSAREALRIIRKIFPFSTHLSEKVGTFKKPCFDAEIGLCPGTCVGLISKTDYLKNIKNIRLFFRGKKKAIISSLEKDMKKFAESLEFEKAAAARKKIFALNHIQDIALISGDESGAGRLRIEGYDISNISGTSSVGSMVVFLNGEPLNEAYRKFRIRTIEGADDPGMIKEVISRRIENKWPLPDMMLVDGGITEVNAAKKALKEYDISVPVIGMIKGPDRKGSDLVGDALPEGADLKTLIRVRDEAHRFAISYHRQVRGVRFFE